MNNKCLYCYKSLEEGLDFHESCSLDFFGSQKPPTIDFSLNQMDELAKKVVERSVAVPGVQAKISMSTIKDSKKNTDSRLTVFDALGGQYILKPPSAIYPEMPENEHLSMRIAESFGIRVVKSSLIRLASGELSYITKRIDRTDAGEKIHMLDMFQITEAFDKYRSSVEKVGKALHAYSENTLLDKLYFFELTLFSFLTGNNDMHLKNFSMINSPTGWILSPAYDLLNVSIVLPEDDEELALTLNGKKKNLKSDNFIHLGKKLGLTDKQIKAAFNRMKKNIPTALEWIRQSFLSPKMQNNYKLVIENRMHRLEI